jgi:hypothetical protein
VRQGTTETIRSPPSYSYPLSVVAKLKPYEDLTMTAIEAERYMRDNMTLAPNEGLVMKDSGSNVHLTTESGVRLYGIPGMVDDRAGKLNGIGSSPTLGTTPLILAMRTTTGKTHVYTHQSALIINDNTGPGTTLISEVILEAEGYTWCSSKDTCTLCTPDQHKIDLIRHPRTGFWFIIVYKKHDLAEKTKLYLSKMCKPPTTNLLSLSIQATRPHAIMKLPRIQPLRSLPQSVEDMLTRLHRTIGHVSIDRLKEIADNDLGHGLEILRTLSNPGKLMPACEGCAINKIKKKPVPQQTVKRLTHPRWGRMSIDSIGQMRHESIEGHRFALICCHSATLSDKEEVLDDGGTGFTLLQGLPHKSDSVLALNKVFSHVKAPCELHSDNAPEFTGEVAQALYGSLNIKKSETPEYTPTANSKAERAIGLIKEFARIHMWSSGVAESAWYLALQYGNLLKCMTSYAPNKKITQWEAYFNEKPRFDHLIPFGCLTFVLLTKDQQKAQGIDHALGPRGLAGLYMGIKHGTMHTIPMHIILTSNKSGHIHIATTFNNLVAMPNYFPGKPSLTIPIVEAQHALLLTTGEEDDDDALLTPTSFLKTVKRANMAMKTYATTRHKQSHKGLEDLFANIDKPSKKLEEKLPPNWFEVDQVIGHKGPPSDREYLVRWKGYDATNDSFVKESQMTKTLLDPYKKKLQEERTQGAQTSGIKIRIIPKDILNGDNRGIDPFAPAEKTDKVLPMKDPKDVHLGMLPPDWTEEQPYPGATYNNLIPTRIYQTPTKKHPLVGRKIRSHFMTDHTSTQAENGTILSYHKPSHTWQVRYEDGQIADVDAEVINDDIINFTGSTNYEMNTSVLDTSTHTAQQTHVQDELDMGTPAPKGMKKILTHPEAKDIMAAINKELDAFTKMDVFEEINYKDLPSKTIEPPIISHLVITRKYKIEKQIEDNKEVFRDVFDKWKARLVFNGKRQVEHGETFSPTPNMSTIMLLLSVCCTLVWDVQHWDLGNAFCGTELKGRDIYVKPPPGLPNIKPGIYWRIKKWVYGLQESNREFYNAFMKLVLSFKPNDGGTIERCASEPCLYIIRDKTGKAICYLLAYVDDLITADSSPDKQTSSKLIDHIRSGWSVTCEGELCRYLGIGFRRLKNGGWEYDAAAYITKSAAKFNKYQLPIKPTTPLPPTPPWSIEKSDWDDYKEVPEFTAHYRTAVGVLLYAVRCGRFDVAYSVSVLSQYLSRPTDKLMKIAYRIMGYLLGTKDLKISYTLPQDRNLQNKLYAAADAGYADCPLTRKSQDGFIIWLNGGPITFRSRKQDIVTLSTAEAELCSLVSAARQLKHCMHVLQEIGYPQHRVAIFEDNRAAISLTEQNLSPGGSRTKHMDIRLKWMQQQVDLGHFIILYTPSKFNPADIMTKPLPKDTLDTCIKGTLSPINTLPPIQDSLSQPTQRMTLSTYIAENQGLGETIRHHRCQIEGECQTPDIPDD